MPSDRTPGSREPAPDQEGQEAGSVVVGLDPSSPAGVAAMAAADLGALFGLGRPYDHRYAPPVRDAMRWSPPADGEETPSCLA
jgi:hypothetical protein